VGDVVDGSDGAVLAGGAAFSPGTGVPRGNCPDEVPLMIGTNTLLAASVFAPLARVWLAATV
jgi:hypothetical protein